MKYFLSLVCLIAGTLCFGQHAFPISNIGTYIIGPDLTIRKISARPYYEYGMVRGLAFLYGFNEASLFMYDFSKDDGTVLALTKVNRLESVGNGKTKAYGPLIVDLIKDQSVDSAITIPIRCDMKTQSVNNSLAPLFSTYLPETFSFEISGNPFGDTIILPYRGTSIALELGSLPKRSEFCNVIAYNDPTNNVLVIYINDFGRDE